MLISVIIPNFNHGKYLSDNLNGLIKQSYKNWEAIVIDDGSTDNSQEILTEFSKKDSRIKPFFLSENQGVFAALEVGLKNMSGDLYYGSGADDYVCNNDFFQKTIDELTKYPNAAGVAFQTTVVDAETSASLWNMGTFFSGYVEGLNAVISFFNRTLFIPGSSVIWKTHLMKKLGFKKDLGGQSDYFFNHALPLYGGICFVNEIAAVYRKSPHTFSAKETSSDYFIHHALIEQRLMDLCNEFHIASNLRLFWRNSVVEEKLAPLKSQTTDLDYTTIKQDAMTIFNNIAGLLA